MPKRMGDEAKVISLFNSLSDDSKRIVLDIIRASQPGKPRKSVASAGKKSSPKVKESTYVIQQPKDGIVLDVAGAIGD